MAIVDATQYVENVDSALDNISTTKSNLQLLVLELCGALDDSLRTYKQIARLRKQLSLSKDKVYIEDFIPDDIHMPDDYDWSNELMSTEEEMEVCYDRWDELFSKSEDLAEMLNELDKFRETLKEVSDTAENIAAELT